MSLTYNSHIYLLTYFLWTRDRPIASWLRLGVVIEEMCLKRTLCILKCGIKYETEQMESLCKCANRIRELYIYNGVYGWVPGGNNKKGGKEEQKGMKGRQDVPRIS